MTSLVHHTVITMIDGTPGNHFSTAALSTRGTSLPEYSRSRPAAPELIGSMVYIVSASVSAELPYALERENAQLLTESRVTNDDHRETIYHYGAHSQRNVAGTRQRNLASPRIELLRNKRLEQATRQSDAGERAYVLEEPGSQEPLWKGHVGVPALDTLADLTKRIHLHQLFSDSRP